jgi:hypothetical protein
MHVGRVKQGTIEAIREHRRDVAAAWSALLHSPNHFISYATEDLFADSVAPVEVAPELAKWRSYMAERYGCDCNSRAAVIWNASICCRSS